MVKKGWGLVTLGNAIQRIRVVFKFAFDNGLIDRPARYGQEFRRLSRKTVRIDRAKKGPKLFTASEPRGFLSNAGPTGLMSLSLRAKSHLTVPRDRLDGVFRPIPSLDTPIRCTGIFFRPPCHIFSAASLRG